MKLIIKNNLLRDLKLSLCEAEMKIVIRLRQGDILQTRKLLYGKCLY
jgi:hypothetical protein